jgi:hypothetical protein
MFGKVHLCFYNDRAKLIIPQGVYFADVGPLTLQSPHLTQSFRLCLSLQIIATLSKCSVPY